MHPILEFGRSVIEVTRVVLRIHLQQMPHTQKEIETVGIVFADKRVGILQTTAGGGYNKKIGAFNHNVKSDGTAMSSLIVRRAHTLSSGGDILHQAGREVLYGGLREHLSKRLLYGRGQMVDADHLQAGKYLYGQIFRTRRALGKHLTVDGHDVLATEIVERNLRSGRIGQETHALVVAPQQTGMGEQSGKVVRLGLTFLRRHRILNDQLPGSYAVDEKRKSTRTSADG